MIIYSIICPICRKGVFGTVSRLWVRQSSAVRLPVGERGFYLLRSIQTNSGAHPASLSPGGGNFTSGMKGSKLQGGYLLPLSPRLRMSGAVPPHPICSHDVYRDFTLLDPLAAIRMCGTLSPLSHLSLTSCCKEGITSTVCFERNSATEMAAGTFRCIVSFATFL